MEFVDRQITCLDCGQPFTFTAGEQQFFERKGFREEPKRCKACRDARKVKRNQPAPSSHDDGEDDDNIGNRAPRAPRAPQATARGPREELGARGSGPRREMFDATCATCGAATRVPFKPQAGRPVYCRDCFSSSKGRVA